MTKEAKTAPANGQAIEQAENVPALAPTRLPYHPAVQERFGIDRAAWKALVEAIFPLAQSVESVILALSYCRARKLDPFKRNVHIVPIWNSQLGRMVDTVWPGIGELRTTAFRTGQYAGRGETIYGPTIEAKVGKVDMKFPEWAQVTVYRMVKDQRVEFAGPQVRWLETYAVKKRDDDSPNSMWEDRPFGQLDKCAEAAALRAAFPEEIGTDYIPEEVQHKHASEREVGLATLPAGRSSFTAKPVEGEDSAPAEDPNATAAVSGEVLDRDTGEVIDGAQDRAADDGKPEPLFGKGGNTGTVDRNLSNPRGKSPAL